MCFVNSWRVCKISTSQNPEQLKSLVPKVTLILGNIHFKLFFKTFDLSFCPQVIFVVYRWCISHKLRRRCKELGASKFLYVPAINVLFLLVSWGEEKVPPLTLIPYVILWLQTGYSCSSSSEYQCSHTSFELIDVCVMVMCHWRAAMTQWQSIC